MPNLGDKVTVKMTGRITKAEVLNFGQVRYELTVGKNNFNFAMIKPEDIIPNESSCEHCGRDFPDTELKELPIPAGEEDFDLIGVCCQCYDHAMDSAPAPEDFLRMEQETEDVT